MTVPDAINGSFELLASLGAWDNIRALWRDKAVKGFRLRAMLLFTTWGYWNLYYYRHLNQWLSWAGGVSMTVANTVYVILIVKYLPQSS